VLFVLVERRAAEPIIPFELFRNRTYVVGNAAGLLINGVGFFGAIVFLPIYMVMVVGVTASAAGLTVMPLTLGLVVASLVSGQIVSRTGRYKVLLLIGTAIVFVGYALMLGLTVETTRWQVTWRMIILGIGIGPALPIFNLAVQNAVNPRQVGVATGSSLFFRQIGSTVGIAVFGTILATVLAARLPVYMPPELRGGTMGNISFSMGQLESGNLASVGNQIRNGLQSTYTKIEAVLTRNDTNAQESLLANPQIPADVKAVLRGGGIAAQVQAGLDTQYQEIAAALTSGKPAALKQLLDDPKLPAPLRDRLGRIPAPAFANPQAMKVILSAIRQEMDTQAAALVAQATQAALTKIKAEFDVLSVTLTAGVTSALKRAFTEAVLRVYFWGMFVILAGFIVTVFLPELALRNTRAQGTMAAEGVPMSEAVVEAAGVGHNRGGE
jgi:hypothetical protein